jgi:hypothetical protein
MRTICDLLDDQEGALEKCVWAWRDALPTRPPIQIATDSLSLTSPSSTPTTPRPFAPRCSAPPLGTAAQLAGIAALLQPGAAALPLRRAAAAAVARLSLLPEYAPLQAPGALAPVVAALADSDSAVAGAALDAVRNLVLDEGARLAQFGVPVRCGVGWECVLGVAVVRGM